ncbi:unnamed protein product [Sphacelaria rigidula]
MKSFDALDSRDNTMTKLGGIVHGGQRRLNRLGIRYVIFFVCNVWKKRNERRNVEDGFIWSRNGTPSRKRCVINGQTTKASHK